MSVEWIVSSCAMVLLVVLLRTVFRKKIQPGIRYVLWLAVALRLLLPVSFSATAVSVLNCLPEREAFFPEQDTGGRAAAGGLEEGLPDQLTAGTGGVGAAGAFLPEKPDTGSKTDGTETGYSPGREPDWNTEGVQGRGSAENVREGNSIEGIRESNGAESIRERDGTESIQEKEGTESIREKDSTESILEKEGTESIQERDSAESILEKNSTGSIQEKEGAGSIREKEGTESIQERDSTESILEKNSTGSIQEKEGTGSVREKEGTESIQERDSTEGKKQTPEEPARLGMDKPIMDMLLKYIWLSGVILYGIVLLLVNVDYGRRLRRSRRRVGNEKLPGESKIPVYIAEMVQTPCLFGFLHPAIYVTEKVAEEEKMLAYVLCHENVHYKHCDNWWALVRSLCLCLHWYNPLVWLAVHLSRQDAELACDQTAVKELGRENRVDYGRALLELGTADCSGISGWRISTTMGGNKRQMKERLQMLVDAPGSSPGIRILLLFLMALVFAVTFTGKNGQSLAASGQDEEMVRWADGISASGRTGEIVSVFLNGAEAGAVSEAKAEKGVFAGKSGAVSLEMKAIEKMDMVHGAIKTGDIPVLDLNFDGWDDLCIPGKYDEEENISYDCMLWNPQTEQYEQSVTIYNVAADESGQWITSRVKEGEGKYSTTYYRYDDENRLHMIRYVEENQSGDAVFEQLDLTYVEGDGPYDLQAVVDGTGFHGTLLAMAKQALEELYQWTGEKVSTACFQVSNMGSVAFGMTPEDIMHSRIFLSRTFGADTEYNLSDYEKCISSIIVPSGRSVWYSPILWKVFPDGMDAMTDEEVVRWYFERLYAADDGRVEKVVKRYEDMWTVQAESGRWFEVCYDAGLREVWYVTGPYPDFPEH